MSLTKFPVQATKVNKIAVVYTQHHVPWEGDYFAFLIIIFASLPLISPNSLKGRVVKWSK